MSKDVVDMETRVCRWKDCQAPFQTHLKGKWYCTPICTLKASAHRHRAKRNKYALESYYRAKERKKEKEKENV